MATTRQTVRLVALGAMVVGAIVFAAFGFYGAAVRCAAYGAVCAFRAFHAPHAPRRGHVAPVESLWTDPGPAPDAWTVRRP